MKIAYLTQPYPPMISGASIFARQLAEGMAGRGHQVFVIAASDRGDPCLTQSGNLSVLRLRSVMNPLRVGQRLLLPARGACLHALDNFEPDLVHAHEPFQLGLTGVAHARRTGIPIIFSTHALPSFITSYLPDRDGLRAGVESLLWIYANWVLRKFSATIAPTQTVSDTVAHRTGIHPQTISYGLDLGIFSNLALASDIEQDLRRKIGIPMSVPILLHVGRLDADKRVERVICAAAQTIKETNAHLLVVGDGCEKPALIKLCQSLGIEDRVHFPGYITVEQGLPDLYHLGTLFITACEIETQGIVLLEAAASGLPIVAVRATCIPEIVHHGQNGFLSEPGDVSGLADSMTMLVKDANQAKQMGEASHQLAQAHNQLKTLEAHEAFYERMIERYKVCALVKADNPVRSQRAA